jgi:hypothetical protein
MTDKHFTDDDLEKLLLGATAPALPQGFSDMLLHRLEAEAAVQKTADVIAFPVRSAPARPTRWLALLPLAAALVGGIYLGAATNAHTLITTGSSIASVEDDDLLGLESLETIEQDGQS